MPHEVVAIALHDSNGFDLGVPSEVFGSARDENGEQLYRVRLCSVDGMPVRTTAGFAASVDFDHRIIAEADTVIVLPGMGARLEPVAPQLRDALFSAQSRGARIVSICTGAFVLAEIGMLDGRRATTYWQRSDEFRQRYPRVALEPDVLYVDDGILSSAGVAAGLDLCMHIIRSDFGVAAANDVARRLVMPPLRFGGQAQYIERARPTDDGDRLSAVILWASEHLGEALSVDVLARRAMMSERSFTRRFREHTGTSPAAWITSERLVRARELLERSDLSIDEIARASGLGTGTHLRTQFQRRYGQSPSEYRRVYRPVA